MTSASKVSQWAYYIALVLIIGTHVYMLIAGLPESQMMAHAILNLVAAALFMVSWVKR